MLVISEQMVPGQPVAVRSTAPVCTAGFIGT